MKILRSLVDKAFVLVLLAFLLAGLGRTLFLPKDVNYYENRPACKMPELSLSSWSDGSFQDGTEDAISDQAPLAQKLKRQYNLFQTGLQKAFLQSVLDSHPRRYLNFSGLELFGGDYIMYERKGLAESAAALDKKRDNYNALFAAHPELDFTVYFVEKETDMNFETGEKSGCWEYFTDGLALPQDNIGAFRIEGFDDYSQYFYKTDHHWNYRGSYRAYTQLAELMHIPESQLLPSGEAVLVQQGFFGSKAASLGTEAFTEDFLAYHFQYPPMAVAINGSPAADYGAQETFFSGTDTPVKYGAFYGGDNGETIFDTGRPERENLLVLGESYDNALLKLLASHYNVTCSVDLRYYEQAMGQPFDFDAYVQEHDIDKVLIIGSLAFYTMEDFLVDAR